MYIYIYSAIVGGKDWEELVAEYELQAHVFQKSPVQCSTSCLDTFWKVPCIVSA